MLKLLRPMRFLRRKAISGGVFGGSRTWLVVGGAAWALRSVGRIFGLGEPRPVFTDELRPGERIVILHGPAQRRRRRHR